MRLRSAALLLLPLLAGCSGIQTFRVVDAQSGQPIAGIRAERLQESLQASRVPLVLVNNMTPVEKQATDSSGVVTFQQTGKAFGVNPALFYPGYGRAFVSQTWSGVKIQYPEEYREISVKPVNGVVEVPLNRRVLPKTPEQVSRLP